MSKGYTKQPIRSKLDSKGKQSQCSYSSPSEMWRSRVSLCRPSSGGCIFPIPIQTGQQGEDGYEGSIFTLSCGDDVQHKVATNMQEPSLRHSSKPTEHRGRPVPDFKQRRIWVFVLQTGFHLHTSLSADTTVFHARSQGVWIEAKTNEKAITLNTCTEEHSPLGENHTPHA